MTHELTDHPDFATMRTALRELNDRSGDGTLSCPNPSCDGTLRTDGGLLSCGTCDTAR